MYQKEHQIKHKKKEKRGKWTKHSAHPKKEDAKTWKMHTHLKFRCVSMVKRTINDFCVKQNIIPSCNNLLPITKEKTRFPWEKEYLRIRNSVVGAVTMSRTGRSGVRSPLQARDFHLLQKYSPTLEPTQPPIQWVLGFSLVPRAWRWPLTSISCRGKE